MATSFTLDPAYLFENGKTAALVTIGGGNDYYNVGNGAYWKWTTSARWIEVDVYMTGTFSVGISSYRLGVRVNDGSNLRDYWFVVPVAGASTHRMWLPPGTNKSVQLFVPAQNAVSAGGAPQGVYPIRARFEREATLVSPSLQANHVVIYGDSIASGGLAVCASMLGYAGLMKRGAGSGGYNGSVTLVSWGYRRLVDDADTAPKRATIAANLVSPPSGPATKVIIAIGSNDHTLPGGPNLANFTAYYGGLLDAIHAVNATMPIVCVSPIIRGASPETANVNGWTLPQGRTAIAGEVASRSGWTVPPTYVDGLAICVLADLPDTSHPSTAANASKMLPAFLAAA